VGSSTELQTYIFKSKYARWDKEKKRRETWQEAVDRVRGMMLTKYAGCGIDEDINWSYDMMQKKKVLGSQRALQYGGKPILDKNARIFNCTAAYCDRLDFFHECFWLLLCGCGTGFSVQKHHIAKLPELTNCSENCKPITFIIPDTIEGWADALKVLILSYVDVDSEYRHASVTFDYSKIRPKGATLSSGIGKAPGPEGLKLALERIDKLLNECIKRHFRTGCTNKLRPIDAYDIVMHASDAVLSGGVRRSASICIFSPDDQDMLTAKAGDWLTTNPQRARSNNSALLLRGKTDYKDFEKLLNSVKEFGEPGFIWADDLEFMLNPCAEIAMYCYDKDGNSGWQTCNLSTINCGTITDEDDFLDRAKAAAVIGTLQAGFTSFDYLGEVSENIVKREALLGVSMTGIMENFEIALNPHVQSLAASLIKDTNARIAKLIGINTAARTTCLKPEGCLNKNSFVQTSEGILTLEEIGDINGDIWQDYCTNIVTDKDDQQTSKFYCNGHFKTKKILTSGGIEIESTYKHRFRVLRGQEYVWVEARDLQNGDMLPYKLGGYTGGKIQTLAKPTLKKSKYASNQRSLQHIDHIDENFAWFLGLYVGDGSNHANKYSIRIHGDYRKQEHLLKAQEYINKTFKLNAYIYKYNQDDDDNRCALYITSKEFYMFLSCNGLLKQKSKDIEIPLSIRCSSSNIVNEYIDGYACADGCNQRYRSFCTTSKNMAQQLVQCLRAIGKDCKMRLMPPTNSSFGNNMRYWIQERVGRGSNKTPYHKYHKILDKHGLSDCSVDRIVDIKDSYCDTYDITVNNNNHTYVANSYISHNTGSMVLGTSAGIHPHHSKRYIRRVQANVTENVYQHFKEYNPSACEKSVWSANDTDEIAMFPIEVPDGAKTKNQLPALEMLKIVKSTQEHWVRAGRRPERCVKPWLCHNVSNTITVCDDEWDDVGKYIYDNREYFTGVALLPLSGDKDYPQAPFTTIYTSREIVKEYGDAAIWCSGLIELALKAFGGNLWKACDDLLKDDYLDDLSVPIAMIDSIAKRVEFWQRGRKYAKKYFTGDIKKLTYCLKDVYNWKAYSDLKESFVHVPYIEMVETEDNTKPEEEAACSGGACLI